MQINPVRDVLSFVASRDLLVFAVGIALSNSLQATLNTLIDALVMPLMSRVTGSTKLKERKWTIPRTDIQIRWGDALNALVVFTITLVTMVEIVKYLTTRVPGLRSSTVDWK